MPDLRRIGGFGILFLVCLRCAVGWQFLYEGLWKLDTQDTAQPWTSAGYLRNAKGPFRDHFREMTGDPDDLLWLDYDHLAAEWTAWADRFREHYALDADQATALQELLDGPAQFSVPLAELPPNVLLEKVNASAVRYDADQHLLVVDGTLHLTPAERDRLLRMVPADEAPQFRKAVADLYKRQSRLSAKERLKVLLKGDPDRAGLVFEEHAGTIDHHRPGDIELYKEQLARYEANLKSVQVDFQFDHLKRQWSELQDLRGRLVGPVKSLDDEWKTAARKLLTQEQLARGALPAAMTRQRQIDLATMWALVVLGGLLIAGCFTRLTAFAGAGLLLSFYLAMPPWPNVPGFQELPGPEHSFIVDKNLIEVIALLTIASLPTGRWFGVDALWAALGARRNAA